MIVVVLFISPVINKYLLVGVQVVHFQPHTLFINRVGQSLCLQQCDSHSEAWIHPTDPPRPFGWQSSAKVEMLKVCVVQTSMPDNAIDIFCDSWSIFFSISVAA